MKSVLAILTGENGPGFICLGYKCPCLEPRYLGQILLTLHFQETQIVEPNDFIPNQKQ